MKKFLVLVACCLLPIHGLAADDCGVPKPIQPLEGLIDESKVKQGDESVIASISGKRVALIVSANAEKQLAWNESLRQPLTGLARLATGMRGDTAQWEQANRDTYDPKVLISRITAPFVSAAKQVKSMSDLAEFRESGFDLAIVLDLNFKCSNERSWSGTTDANTEIEIAAYPLNPSFVMGPVVRGGSKFRSKYEPGHPEVARWRQDAMNVRVAAAKDFQVNVERAYPGTKTASRPTGADAPGHAAAQSRLESIDDLRKRGLISEKEAEAKRSEILRGL